MVLVLKTMQLEGVKIYNMRDSSHTLKDHLSAQMKCMRVTLEEHTEFCKKILYSKRRFFETIVIVIDIKFGILDTGSVH